MKGFKKSSECTSAPEDSTVILLKNAIRVSLEQVCVPAVFVLSNLRSSGTTYKNIRVYEYHWFKF